MKRLRVLALSPVPLEGAGCRFRIAQFIPYLAEQGIDVTIAPFYDREFFELVYRPGQVTRKARLFVRQAAARLPAVLGAGRYDVLFIYREAFPIGPPILEALLRAFNRPVVYDFDDAVFLPNTSDANAFVAALKYPRKVGWIIGRSDVVIAGNEYLASFARRFNWSVQVIPTSVDTDLFVPSLPPRRPRSVPVVGWIGTPTTAGYLQAVAKPLVNLTQQSAFILRVAGDGGQVTFPGVAVEALPWSLDKEVELFNTCDVGIYPMPDDPWTKGKCGFKAIQFMACGVPVVASPVGVNTSIIDDGVTGFFARTDQEWESCIGRLLADPELRRRMGAAARRAIEQRYSVRVNAPRIAAVIRRAAEGARAAEPVASAAGGRR
jgi:glycosyltransferase involved in cell wall biosynthesis